jgi:RNA polymerase sigma-B factor
MRLCRKGGIAMSHHPEQSIVDTRQRDLLVEEHLPLAYRLARRFSGRNVPLEDLRQVAAEGLVKAATAFDPGRGTPFAAFATPTIIGMLKRHFRDHTWGVRVPRSLQERSLAISAVREELTQTLRRSPTPRDLADRMGISVAEVIEAIEAAAGYRSFPLDPGAETVRTSASGTISDPAIEKVEVLQALGPLVRALPEQEQQMLAMRFREEMTQTQIAERLGISQMQVSRQLSRCMRRLRSQLLAPV